MALLLRVGISLSDQADIGFLNFLRFSQEPQPNYMNSPKRPLFIGEVFLEEGEFFFRRGNEKVHFWIESRATELYPKMKL